MTHRIAALDVPLPALRDRIAELVARQNEQRAQASADRLRTVLAPTHTETPEEAS